MSICNEKAFFQWTHVNFQRKNPSPHKFWPVQSKFWPDRSTFWADRSTFWTDRSKFWPVRSKFWPVRSLVFGEHLPVVNVLFFSLCHMGVSEKMWFYDNKIAVFWNFSKIGVLTVTDVATSLVAKNYAFWCRRSPFWVHGDPFREHANLLCVLFIEKCTIDVNN